MDSLIPAIIVGSLTGAYFACATEDGKQTLAFIGILSFWIALAIIGDIYDHWHYYYGPIFKSRFESFGNMFINLLSSYDIILPAIGLGVILYFINKK